MSNLNERILKALQNGGLTSAQMRARYGLRNPYSNIQRLRDRGYIIDTCERGYKKVNGKKIMLYKYVMNGSN